MDSRADTGAAGNAASLVEQGFFEGREEQENVILLGRPAHQADAPDLALDGAESAGDLDAELITKLCANFAIVGARRDFDGDDCRQAVGGIADKRVQAQTFDSGARRLRVLAMAI